MAKNRVLFALWLLLWLSIWLWGSGNAAGFLLLASLLAAALEISLSLLVRRRITASLSAPVSCRKGEDLTVELRASNACFFSCAGLRAVLRCRNLLTGETEEPPRLDALYDALSPDCFYLELQDRTTRCRDLWEHCGEDTLRGLFLRDLRQRYDAAPEEEKPRLLQAARFGLAALENREL